MKSLKCKIKTNLNLIESFGKKIKGHIPHYKLKNKIRFSELLGELALIRSRLNSKIYDYSILIKRLNTYYSKFYLDKDGENNGLINILVLQKQIIDKKQSIELLIIENDSILNSISLLNIYNDEDEIYKGLDLSLQKIEKLNQDFEKITTKLK